jgi:hypothetical protein
MATMIGTEKKMDVCQCSHIKYQHTREIIKNYVQKFQAVPSTDIQGCCAHTKVIK